MIKKSIYFLKRKFKRKKLNCRKAFETTENKRNFILEINILKEIEKLVFDICVKYLNK